ncbi:hypothetical protein ACFPRL_31025 [Pseudoclavibacter helvolus]
MASTRSNRSRRSTATASLRRDLATGRSHSSHSRFLAMGSSRDDHRGRSRPAAMANRSPSRAASLRTVSSQAPGRAASPRRGRSRAPGTRSGGSGPASASW